MNLFLLVIIQLLFLVGCAQNSDEKILNDRISILSYASDLIISAESNPKEIKLAKSKEIIYWSQSGQNPQNNLPHYLSSLKFKNKKKILSDSGNATNTIQPIYFEGNLCSVSTKGFLICTDLESEEKLWELDLKIEGDKSYEIMRGGLAYFDNQLIKRLGGTPEKDT